MKAIPEPMNVKKRKREEKAVIGAHLPACQQIHGVRYEVVVREYRTF
jgi:hypothetical protein